MNKVIIIGRLGADPMTMQLENNAVTTINVATSKKWTNKSTGEKQEETQWHNVKLWAGLSEIASKYLRKGALVMIEGELKYSMSEKDGVKRYFTEITARNMEMLGSNNQKEEKDDLPY